MPKTSKWRVLLGPWMIPIFLFVGWGPLFLDDFVTSARPELNNGGEAFAMGWMIVTFWCGLFTIIYAVGHIVRLALKLARRFCR